MSLLPNLHDFARHSAGGRRISVRDSYLPAAGLLFAAAASLGLWVALVEAARLLLKAVL